LQDTRSLVGRLHSARRNADNNHRKNTTEKTERKVHPAALIMFLVNCTREIVLLWCGLDKSLS